MKEKKKKEQKVRKVKRGKESRFIDLIDTKESCLFVKTLAFAVRKFFERFMPGLIIVICVKHRPVFISPCGVFTSQTATQQQFRAAFKNHMKD